MSLDVTPIQIEGFGDTPTTASEFTVDNAAFVYMYLYRLCSLFLPAPVTNMQRIEVDWNNLQKSVQS